ncbi:tetratricopeptide repeat protein [Mycobacterium koreense]|uniref:tetratricopeptide repeat protein n=1 Tax=Mycolicibacillus koreensis TaxID=1069220 RepID=UPI001056848A|nr:tetratricopeptide repeat protein [Mycolicibacillus koreensis]MCV7248783.1 tetratricopeptide repeat protein [Mycolicibacillus koreensis]BBY53627.1 hypothetical protein MKOR_08780 [Mycolicibacillus koreensis]
MSEPDVDAVIERAQLLAELGQLADADAALRAALTSEPDDPRLLTELAAVALQAGDIVTASPACTRASAWWPPATSNPISRTRSSMTSGYSATVARSLSNSGSRSPSHHRRSIQPRQISRSSMPLFMVTSRGFAPVTSK